MLEADMINWVKTEFEPVRLMTSDDTILQCITNAKRRWNVCSAYPIVRMYSVGVGANSNSGIGGNRVQLDPDYKSVVKVYPAMTPDWILQNYPLWSLLGITVIDNLTSDLIELSEAYRSYRYYMGTDFQYRFMKSDDPMIGGFLNLVNLPSNSTSVAVVGCKRIVYGGVTLTVQGLSGTFTFTPVTAASLTMTDGNLTYEDDGNGNLVPSLSGYSDGTINYITGQWSVPKWTVNPMINITATYDYTEDVKSEYMLNWLLYYIKALVKRIEGNTLRKIKAVKIDVDGQEMVDEGKQECEELEKRLFEDGRWLSFCRKF